LISPCLWFDGLAQEAAEFYCYVFPNSKINTQTPVVVDFELFGQSFLGLNGGAMFKINPSISFYVSCETVAEVEDIWAKFMEWGTVMMPLDTYPWSEKYGWLKDRFGMTWQITVDKNIKQKITPSMMFAEGVHGKGKEAIDFYTSIFKDTAIVHTSYYAKGQNPYATEGMVLFSLFTLAGQSFIIMDAGGPQPFTFNEGLSFIVHCDNQAEVDYYWSKLTEGGEESMCAWLKDKYGVSWQIVPKLLTQLLNDPDREKAGRAMDAMFKMRKIDTVALQRAFDGE
jgi:predicted 3-demethylubiquinone-9 3-methyltransferase (glyoxalase superfamily)